MSKKRRKHPAVRRIRNIFSLYLDRKGPLFAQGIAFSLLIGLIPLLLLLTAVASLLYGILPGMQTGLEHKVTDFLPKEVAVPLLRQILSITKGWASLGGVGIITLFFFARVIFNSLGSGLSGVMGGSFRRAFVVSELYSVALTFMTIVLLVSAAAAEITLKFAVDVIPISMLRDVVYPLLVKSLSVVFLALALLVLYHVFSKVRANRRFALAVSFVVSLLWHLAGFLGNSVIVLLAQRTVIYGVFAGTVLFLLWLQIFAHLVLLGGIVIANHDIDSSRTQPMQSLMPESRR